MFEVTKTERIDGDGSDRQGVYIDFKTDLTAEQLEELFRAIFGDESKGDM